MPLVDMFEEVQKQLADELVAQRRTMRDALGERSFEATEVPTGERVNRYLEMRDTPEAWDKLLTRYGAKSVIQSALKMERLLAGRTGGGKLPLDTAEPGIEEQGALHPS